MNSRRGSTWSPISIENMPVGGGRVLDRHLLQRAQRTLQQVTIEDAADADRIFSMLMGDVVEHRRVFIEDNALAATVDV